MNPQEAYEELVARSKELYTIGSIDSLVSWDQQVNMPPKGISHRARMMSYLAQVTHQKATDPRFGELLDIAGAAEWPAGQAACLREWRRSYDLETKLPEELVKRRAELTANAAAVWEKARPENDFPAFAPYLSQLVDLSREMADLLGWQGERYDALLDLYEPGLTTVRCEALFGELRDALVPLLQRIQGSPRQPDERLFGDARFSQEAQRRLGIEMSKALGFDYEAGRLDISAHPFTSHVFPGDVRLTTRYSEQEPFQSIMGTIHEAGHGMYEQGLPLEQLGTPLAQTVSLGLHESQSRFFENNIGRSRAFWRYWFPRFRSEFGDALAGVQFDDFYALLNRVQPSLIRVEADEVTYNLHIMVRFELERDLLRGKMQSSDLPDAWVERYRQYLGIAVPNHRLGVLQDVHWAWGSFGYFPTYSLGTIYAGQLEAALRRDVPDLDSQLERGEFGAPLGWMREHVHRYGQLYRPDALIQHATGALPSARDYIDYLNQKYGELYG